MARLALIEENGDDRRASDAADGYMGAYTDRLIATMASYVLRVR